MKGTTSRWWLLLVALSGACSDDEAANFINCTPVGPNGDSVTSTDGVLTIAIRPGALVETIDVCIREAETYDNGGPPDIYGPAYRISPDIGLDLNATITLQTPLPDPSSSARIAAILYDDFARGEGEWIELPVARIDPDNQLITASDVRLSMFYGLVLSESNASD